MHVLRMAAALILSVAMTVGVSAAQAPPAEASLAFARKNIWNWEADGQQGIWVQDIGHQWYYGKFMAPCIDLPFREGLDFRFGPSGELDKFSAIVIRHEPPCNFISFTRSDGPPHAHKGRAQAAPAPTAAP